MARVVLVHGTFNEFRGPHEPKVRWLPVLQDALWQDGVEIADARGRAVMTCRRDPR
jgi:hypothetical protein